MTSRRKRRKFPSLSGEVALASESFYRGAPGCHEWSAKEFFSFFFLTVVQADRPGLTGGNLAWGRHLTTRLDPSPTLRDVLRGRFPVS